MNFAKLHFYETSCRSRRDWKTQNDDQLDSNKFSIRYNKIDIKYIARRMRPNRFGFTTTVSVPSTKNNIFDSNAIDSFLFSFFFVILIEKFFVLGLLWLEPINFWMWYFSVLHSFRSHLSRGCFLLQLHNTSRLFLLVPWLGFLWLYIFTILKQTNFKQKEGRCVFFAKFTVVFRKTHPFVLVTIFF